MKEKNQVQLLILPGWMHTSDYWQQSVKALRQKGYVVDVIDLPGFGVEPLLSTEWGVPEYASWVQGYIMDNYKDKSIVLIGHSFGGRVASYIAHLQPSWLEQLVLIAAPCIYRPSLNTQLRIGFYKLIKNILPKKSRQRFYSSESKQASKDKMGTVFRKAVTYDATHLLPQINVPTHILWGQQDQYANVKLATEMAQLIPQPTVTILPGVGHNMHLENTNLMVAKLDNLIASHL